MTAILSPVPKLQFFDDAGNLLVGGLLYSYAAGTTTPLATFTDSSGNTQNTNPIELDARGEASVWLGEFQYKLTLKDADDVEIWTVDDVSGEFVQANSITTAMIQNNAVTTNKIANSAVTYAKIQNVSATDRVLGRSSSGAGVVQEITCTSFARSLIDDADQKTALVTLGALLNLINPKSASYTVDVADRGQLIDFTTATTTLTLLAAATAEMGFVIAAKNSASSGIVTVDPDGEKIDGSTASLSLNPGESVALVCNGTDGWVTIAKTSAFPGKLLQEVTSTSAAYTAVTAEIPYDDTIPQNTEGQEFLTVAITPKAATSTLVISGSLITNHAGDGGVDTFAVFKDSDTGAIYAAFVAGPANTGHAVAFSYRVSAASTAARTYKLRVGTDSPTSSTLQINGYNGARILGGVVVSSFTVQEISA